MESQTHSKNDSLKSEQRRRYENEVMAVQKLYGSLEEIRESLGLNQRKMAELLMVDPSAWTRWTKGGGEAPPHIYRALGWYMELRGLQARLQPLAAAPAEAHSIAKVKFAAFNSDLPAEWEQRFEEMRTRERLALDERLNKTEQITLGWKLFLLLNTAAIIYIVLSSI